MTDKDSIQQAVRDPKRLETLRNLNILDTQMEPAFDRLTALASNVLNAPISLVSLVDSDRQWFKSQAGLDGPRETPLSHSFCKHVVATNDDLIVHDAPHHPELKDNLAIHDLGVMAYAGIPLTLSNGQTVGSLCVIDTEPRKWLERDIVILRDIAAATITELELRLEVHRRQQAETELTALNDELRAFGHTVAHDLRGPLGILMGVFEILDAEVAGHHAQRALQTGARTAAAMQRIIDSLLLFAEARHQDVPMQLIDSHRAFMAAIERFDFEIEQLGITLEVADELPHVRAYMPWLEEVFANLISNAVKYIGATNEKPRIKVYGETKGTQAFIHVEDNGIGIREEDQKYLGELFTRFTEDTEGSGLGISIVLRLLRRMGGQLHVKSTLGEGSIFSVALPTS